MFKILTFNNISPKGLAEFDPQHYEVGPTVSNPDAILLRSQQLHDTPVPDSVRVIVRAGAGTNNIPIAKMTDQGIAVLNTPGANANAVKELVITGMLLACRNIFPAYQYVQTLDGDDASIHKAVEAQKKQFAGFELPGKTLGVIGLGKIGVKVANAARYLDMKVIGFDPAMTVQNAWELRSSVKQADSIEEVLQSSDFISLHVPLIDATRHLINAQRLQQMKPGAILMNFSREGIVDNNALLEAINSQQLHRYVCDFPSKDFIHNDRIICLPHLGASTIQAEENCAVMAAQQIQSFLEEGHIKHSVNFPNVKMPKNSGYRISIVNNNVPNMVAQITTVLSSAGLNILDLINKSRDQIAYNLVDVDSPPSEATLQALTEVDGIIRVHTPCQR